MKIEKKYIVFYVNTTEVVFASTPGEAKRFAQEKNKEAGLNIAITAVRPA